MADSEENIHSRLSKNLHGWDQISAAIAYVPLVGWAYTWFTRQDDPLCKFHGKQAMQLNALYAGLYLVIWFVENFPLTRWIFGERAFLHPLSETISLVSTFVFLALSAVAAFRAFSEERWEIPYLKEAIDWIVELLRFPQ
ncbi:MAG: hypothetical protein KDK39_12940 [Leptospiraceae bacterium]|nr:hypothetical protein [Leptospiraceae bacterium]